MISIEEDMLECRSVIKSNIIDVFIEEIGFCVNMCKVPSKVYLQGESSSNPLPWSVIN